MSYVKFTTLHGTPTHIPQQWSPVRNVAILGISAQPETATASAGHSGPSSSGFLHPHQKQKTTKGAAR